MREAPFFFQTHLDQPGCVKLLGEYGEACQERALVCARSICSCFGTCLRKALMQPLHSLLNACGSTASRIPLDPCNMLVDTAPVHAKTKTEH